MNKGNPWESIALSDYEGHMSLDGVRQLQEMNRIMQGQFEMFPVTSAMVLGIAGGNGLEHVNAGKYRKVYGVDINPQYLKEVSERYGKLSGILECLCLDLLSQADSLPHAELLIANLLIEYIGYDAFQKVLEAVRPGYVSCVIQVNEGDGFVSDSPYLHAFDRLSEVHHEMNEAELTQAMEELGYHRTAMAEYPLPNGKKLVRLDYNQKRPL